MTSRKTTEGRRCCRFADEYALQFSDDTYISNQKFDRQQLDCIQQICFISLH